MLHQIFTKADLVDKSELEIIDLIVERYRRRTAWHKAEKSLTLQGRAICRRLCDSDKDRANALFDRVAKLKSTQIDAILHGFIEDIPAEIVSAINELHPILIARLIIEDRRNQVEAELERMVKRLPIAAFVEEEDCSGFSYGSLAAVVGSAGNLWRYATVGRLWKRMGMAVIDGGRQRHMRGKIQALLHGYSPGRRSVMWNIGTSVLLAQSERQEKEDGKKTGVVLREAGHYRKIYDERRAYESVKNENGDYAAQAEKRLAEADFGEKTVAFKAYSAGKLPPMHLHARAQRYVEKRFLRDLWSEWRKTMTKPAAPPELLLEPESVAA